MIECNKACEDDLKKLPFNYDIKLLSDSTKEVIYYIDKKNIKSPGNSYYKEITSYFKDAIEVKLLSTTLDNMAFNVNFDFIKLDTQGSELDILKGGNKLVKYAKYILLEASIKPYNENAPLFNDMVEYLFSKGFHNYSIIEEHNWTYSDDKLYNRGDLFQVDVIFKR
jgi:FkbM family methyltransferase